LTFDWRRGDTSLEWLRKRLAKEPQDGAATVGLLQGTLDLLVLRVLVAGPLHGYAISRRLAELSDEWFSVDEGSLYPCLYRMEKKGWIGSETGRSENNRRARFYSLTKAGTDQLETEQENWRRFQSAVGRVLRRA
jgi:PadR family transcriptional regulator, regulatory protein PadR